MPKHALIVSLIALACSVLGACASAPAKDAAGEDAPKPAKRERMTPERKAGFGEGAGSFLR